MTADAPDGRGPRAAGGHDLPAVVRMLRDRLSVAQLRTASILAGGAAGALVRAGVGRAIPVRPGEWPWATFTVNIAGALILAWVTTRLAETVAPTRYWRLLVGTGFCGALTTFSTFQVETIRLARDGHTALGLGYATASMAAGMAAAVGATVLARRHRYG
jgi:CrcB protein